MYRSDLINEYLAGLKLYGNDLDQAGIEQWFLTEVDGYSGIKAADSLKYEYEYHALNLEHGYRFLAKRMFNVVLGIGSAFGDELESIAAHANNIIILEPARDFAVKDNIQGTPVKYVVPENNGKMPFRDRQFELITCFGVLHHVPNVSFVLSEAYRCLDSGGIMIVREPIVSMGDWRFPRAGLTKNERGIPLAMFGNIIDSIGFEIVKATVCDFSPLVVLANKLGIRPFNSNLLVKLDAIMGRLFLFNYKYHRSRKLDSFAPSSVMYVLKKK